MLDVIDHERALTGDAARRGPHLRRPDGDRPGQGPRLRRCADRRPDRRGDRDRPRIASGSRTLLDELGLDGPRGAARGIDVRACGARSRRSAAAGHRPSVMGDRRPGDRGALDPRRTSSTTSATEIGWPLRVDEMVDGVELDVDAISDGERLVRAGHPGAGRSARGPLGRQRGGPPAADGSRARAQERAAEAAGRIALALERARHPQRPDDRGRRSGGGDRGEPAREPDRPDRRQGHGLRRGRRRGALRAGLDAGRGRARSRASRRTGCWWPSRRRSARSGACRASATALGPEMRSTGEVLGLAADAARCDARWPSEAVAGGTRTERAGDPAGDSGPGMKRGRRLQYGGSWNATAPRRHESESERTGETTQGRVRPELPSATGPAWASADNPGSLDVYVANRSKSRADRRSRVIPKGLPGGYRRRDWRARSVLSWVWRRRR